MEPRSELLEVHPFQAAENRTNNKVVDSRSRSVGTRYFFIFIMIVE